MIFRLCLIVLSGLAIGSTSLATMRFVYHAPESAHDFRYKYHWEILKAALEQTSKKFGPYTFTPSAVMTEDEQLSQMKKRSPALTVMIRETNHIFEDILTPVRIPVDKNLMGYRVLLINKKDQAQISKITSLAELRKLSLGQGAGWGDISILEHSGFKVKTELRYDDLFKSLSQGKFKIFPRSVIEIQQEFRQFKNRYPDLAIEHSLLLYYPLPTYFWFHESADGRVMAQRVEEGLKLMIKSGAYQKIFDKHYAKVIRELGLKKRTLISIPNPNLPASVPFDRKELWFDPLN